MSHAVALWVSLALLLGNAFFVGAEFAAMAARRSTLEPLAAQGNRRAAVCLRALEQLGSLLVTAQLGITVCSVGIGALAESALDEIFEHAFHALQLRERFGWSDAWMPVVALIVALLVVVYLHVVIGEMIPKNLTIAGPDRAALVLVPALLYVAVALTPIVWLVQSIAKRLVKMMGVEPKDEIASTFTAAEVAHIAEASGAEGLLAQEQHGMVRSAIAFSDKRAHDVGVPIDTLVTVSLGVTPADLERLVAQHGFSRYPLRDSAGEIAGYLHLKDVLYDDAARYDDPIPLKRVRRLATVKPGDEVEDVLETMQHTAAHLARVVGSDGRVSGVVFLEDVLEELVGEVTDAASQR